MSRETVPRQLPHLVFGGELIEFDAVTFKNLDELDIIGISPNARHLVVHRRRLLEPDAVGATPPR